MTPIVTRQAAQSFMGGWVVVKVIMQSLQIELMLSWALTISSPVFVETVISLGPILCYRSGHTSPLNCQEWTFFNAHACKVTLKHIPEPLNSQIFRTLVQLLNITPFAHQNITVLSLENKRRRKKKGSLYMVQKHFIKI